MRSLQYLLVGLLCCVTSPALASAQGWAVAPQEHVDLWLHGFAMVHDDASAVPLYRRGYRDEVLARKRATDVLSDLDVNREKLGAGLAAAPTLVGAQFVALDFGTWEEMQRGITLWLDANGDLRRIRARQDAELAARIGSYFRTARDRDWLRLFYRGLEDERVKYFAAQWAAEQEARVSALRTSALVWRDSAAVALAAYLSRTQQIGGTVIPSFVLEGEGRTIQESRTRNFVVTGLPATDTAAWELSYVMAHEVVGSIAAAAVQEHTTPAQQRSGEAERYSALALVRAGAVLMERAIPAQAEGYMRFYLRAAGRPVLGDVRAAFAEAFPIPAPMLEGMRSQVAVILGGI
jgi:hypothetical protein